MLTIFKIESKLATQVPQLWEAYLERFADMKEDIRKICIQHISDFLIQQAKSITQKEINTSITSAVATSSPSPIIEQIIEQIKDRSLDPDESLRYEVVQEILKAIKVDTNLITSDLLNVLQKRTLDVKVSESKLHVINICKLGTLQQTKKVGL